MTSATSYEWFSLQIHRHVQRNYSQPSRFSLQQRTHKETNAGMIHFACGLNVWVAGDPSLTCMTFTPESALEITFTGATAISLHTHHTYNALTDRTTKLSPIHTTLGLMPLPHSRLSLLFIHSSFITPIKAASIHKLHKQNNIQTDKET